MSCMERAEERRARARSREIDELLKAEGKEAAKEVKLLVLGSSGSGKSTVIKQLKIMCGGGYSSEECSQYRPLVYSNTVHSMVVILQAMNKLGIEFEDHNRSEDAQKVFAVASHKADDIPFTTDFTESMKALWADGGVQECFRRAYEYQLDMRAEYYLSALDRLAQPDYTPTEQDVLRVQVKATTLQETSFTRGHLKFKAIEVGDLRYERRKCIHYFEEVAAIVFCVSLSEYDRVLESDGETNQLVDSMKLFDFICNNRWFWNVPIVLVLNNTDLLAERLVRSPLTICFPEYNGQNTFDDAKDYIRQRFESLNMGNKLMVTHFLHTNDMERNIRYVLDAVFDVLIKQHLRNVGL